MTHVDREGEVLDLPERLVVGMNGAYWRDYGDHYSMPPVSPDNTAVDPAAVYVRRDSSLNDSVGIYRGLCGHVWDRRVEDTAVCPRCAQSTADGLKIETLNRLLAAAVDYLTKPTEPIDLAAALNANAAGIALKPPDSTAQGVQLVTAIEDLGRRVTRLTQALDRNTNLR